MTHIDRRTITNGKAPRRPDGPLPPRKPMTVGEFLHPDHLHRPVTRAELAGYGDALGDAITKRWRDNQWHRRVWRWARLWWAYLTTPRAGGST